MRKTNRTEPKIAYVLKNFPKLSETFIAGEIYRLEQLGVNLKLFVIKPPAENLRHAVVDKIRAERFNLPATASLTETRLVLWLKNHLPDFAPCARRTLRRNPWGFFKAAGIAFAQSIRSRKSAFAFPKKTYFKEFLQAALIADQIAEDEQIGHIHAHFAHGAATAAWLAALMSGRKFSFTAHAKDIYLESLNPAGFLKRKMEAAEFVVTCTKANRAHLEAIAPRTPVHCLYHGLSVDFTELLAAERCVSGARNERLRLLAVGRLVRKKGFDVFVRACGILRAKGVNFEAVIVGETGDHAEEIKRLIARENLAGFVKLAGAMSQNELFEEYHRADVFCLPCRILENGDRDGIPNVMMEAMACGLPVVTTDVSGIPEIIRSGENGLLVAPDEPEAFAAAIQKIQADKNLSKRLAKAAIETVREKFDGAATALKLAQLLRQGTESAETIEAQSDEMKLGSLSFKPRAN